MAFPRIFISSTCYDLQEIRHNLRNFIQEFMYEPVMSEFGDIFYDFNTHVQDSCIKEVEKAQMFVVIIGNNYGSKYHQESSEKIIPDSVTLQEFKKAISTNIPKIMFIHKYVNYDYRNYIRALTIKIKDYFNSNEVEENEINNVKEEIRNSFDQNYPFPEKNYKYIFRFLDIVDNLKKNNAILEYETFEEIKQQLKKQWAGYLYEKLSEDKKDKTIKEEKNTLIDLRNKINIIDELIRELVEKSRKGNGSINISMSDLEDTLALKDLKDAREILSNSLFYILNEPEYYGEGYGPTITFNAKITNDEALLWMDSINEILNKYKWSKTVPTNELFEVIKNKVNKYEFSDINIDELIKLNTLFKKIQVNEKENIATVVKSKFNNNCIIIDDEDEGIPF